MEAMIKSHAVDSALPEMLMKEVPHRAGGTIDSRNAFTDCSCWQSRRERKN
jgi:hypothetical protein